MACRMMSCICRQCLGLKSLVLNTVYCLCPYIDMLVETAPLLLVALHRLVGVKYVFGYYLCYVSTEDCRTDMFYAGERNLVAL